MITLISHGNKFGDPRANVKFDVSYFLNPWRDHTIRHEKDPIKRRKKILAFMDDQDAVVAFVARVESLIRFYSTVLPDENIVIAFCCSAGEYRSPAIVEMVSDELTKLKIKHKTPKCINSKL